MSTGKFALKSLVGALAVGMAGAAAAETMKEVVTFAIETHPQVLSAAKRKDAADSAINAARGGYFPRIDYLYGAGREHSKNVTTLATTPNWVKLNRTQEGMILNQMLFDGLGVAGEVDRRKAISDSSAHRVYSAAEDTALQTIEAYLDVMKNQALAGYARENLQAHQRTFDQVKLRADKGVGRRADLEQIDARLALAISNVAAAESTLRDAEIAYLKVVGKPPQSLARPEAPPIPGSADEAVKIAVLNHPILRSALSDVDAAQAQREIARSFYFPRLELEASYSDNKNIDGVVGPNRDRLIMLWVKWNVFRGGFDYNRDQETAKQINEAQEIARNTNRQVEAAVRLAYNAFATARDRLPSLDRYVKASDATRDAYNKQFAIGQRTLLDLLDSENEFFTSRSTYINALFIELSARFRVLNAMGSLLTALEIKAPEEAFARTAATVMPPEDARTRVAQEPKEPVQSGSAGSEQPRAETKPAEQPAAATVSAEQRSEQRPAQQSQVMRSERAEQPVVLAPQPPVQPQQVAAAPPAPQQPAEAQPTNAPVEERKMALQD
ncbi:MAG TPA: TolC family outer membrane protein [Burkholderiales bacterium]|nr:TolC family outer membrane protein [Burkholderiales bacterium]